MPEETGKNRDEKGHFIEGISGNPNGRPKGSVSIVEEIKRKLETIPEGEKKTYLQIFVEKLFKKGIDESDTTLMKDLIDRVDGKPQQNIKADVEGTILLLDKDEED
jgi:hypothetical protein